MARSLRPTTGRGSMLVFLILPVLGASCAESPNSMEMAVPREPVEVEALVDRAVATTGDLLTYSIRVDSDSAYEVEIPEAGADIAGFRIVDIGREEPWEKGDRAVREHWYQLRADLVGSYVLPPVEVRYRQRAEEGTEPGPWETQATSEIFVEVESVLPTDGEASDIRDLKPLREVRPGFPWLLLLSTLIGAGVIAALIIWDLRRRARARDSVPPRPAHELAFEALDRLRRIEFEDPEAVRWFYFSISEVVRAYVEGRFRLNATDLTTEEILAGLETLQGLESEQNQVLGDFLQDTDQVKYAHHEPSRGDIEGTYEKALSFVEATRPVAVPDEQEKAA